MDHECVNPYCTCPPPCSCERPCRCGLVKVEHATAEEWDASAQVLRFTVRSTYRHDPRGRDAADPGHDHGGPPPAPEEGDPADLLAASIDPGARRRSVLARYGEAAGHDHGAMASERTATHRGHEILIRTTYEAYIDGERLEAHLGVADDGNVHYHALPNYTTGSAIDLLRQVIDSFPEDYPPLDEPEEGER